MKKRSMNQLGRFFLLLFLIGSVTGWLFAEDEKNANAAAVETKTGSLAWQMEELLGWLVRTRDLVPRAKECQPPCYVVEAMNISGDARTNRFTFTLTGSIIANQPILIPLFGPPSQVLLRGVRINGQPAVVGFEGRTYYYVRTAEKRFSITGEMSLPDEMSFSVPGYVNLFTAALESGRIVEGSQIPGLNEATLHVEFTGKSKQAVESRPPVFQIARAIRIRKEISFEYKVNLQSSGEISSVKIPLGLNETVLDVPEYSGWKQQNGELLVPVSGNEVELDIKGRIDKLQSIATDPRSSYEWWLVEADAEHRFLVNTDARQVDVSESPISRELSISRLFLLSKGQKLDINIQPLVGREALAVIISQQYRNVVWTKDGDLVAEDLLQYQNNGIDYLPFDCSGKPVFLETDGKAQKILAESQDKPEIYIPLDKGYHTSRIQSTASKLKKPGWLFGILRVPVPRHSLTVSKSILVLGLPERIRPIWFSGVEGVASPITWTDLLFMAITLAIILIIFKKAKLRWLGLIVFAGLYFALPVVYFLLLAALLISMVFLLINRRTQGKKRLLWSGVALVSILVIFIIVYVSYLSEPEYMGQTGSAGIGYAAGYVQPPGKPQMSMAPGSYAEAEYERRVKDQEDESKRLALEQNAKSKVMEDQARMARVPVQASPAKKPEDIFSADKNVVEGVIPVPLPMPSYASQVFVTREIVTPERPLHATLVYVTTAVLFPLLLLWILACACMVYLHRGLVQKLWVELRNLWKPVK